MKGWGAKAFSNEIWKTNRAPPTPAPVRVEYRFLHLTTSAFVRGCESLWMQVVRNNQDLYRRG